MPIPENIIITLTNVLWRVLQFISKQGFKFIITVYSASILPKEDFDRYAYIIVIINLIIMFSDMGISSSLVYKCKKLSEFESVAIPLAFIGGATGVISVLIISRINLFSDNTILYHSLPLIIITPIFSIFDGYYRIKENFKIVSSITGFTAIISLFFIKFLISTFGILGIIYGLSFQMICSVILIAIAFLYQERIKNFHFDWSKTIDIFKYGLSVGGATIAAFFYTKIDIVIMENYGLNKWNGTYELLFQFMTIATIPGTIIAQVLASRISQQEQILNRVLYQRILSKSPYAILVTIPFYFIINQILEIYYPNYVNDIATQAVLCVSILLPFKIWGVFQTQSFFVSLGMARFVLLSTIIAAFFNIILDIIMINKFGFIGVIYVTLIIHSCNILIQTFYLNKLLKEKNEA